MRKNVIFIIIISVLCIIFGTINSIAYTNKTQGDKVNVFTGTTEGSRIETHPYEERIWFDNAGKLNVLISGRSVLKDVWDYQNGKLPTNYEIAIGTDAVAKIYCTAHGKPIWSNPYNTTESIRLRKSEKSDYYKQTIMYESRETSVEEVFDGNTLQGVGYVLSALKNRTDLTESQKDQIIQLALWRTTFNDYNKGSNPDDPSAEIDDDEGAVITSDYQYPGKVIENILKFFRSSSSTNFIEELDSAIGHSPRFNDSEGSFEGFVGDWYKKYRKERERWDTPSEGAQKKLNFYVAVR